jgi:hypothetical protein
VNYAGKSTFISYKVDNPNPFDCAIGRSQIDCFGTAFHAETLNVIVASLCFNHRASVFKRRLKAERFQWPFYASIGQITVQLTL